MKKIFYLLLLLFHLSSFSQAQYKKGFGFTTGAWGSGFHFMGDWELKEDLFSEGTASIDLRALGSIILVKVFCLIKIPKSPNWL